MVGGDDGFGELNVLDVVLRLVRGLAWSCLELSKQQAGLLCASSSHRRGR